MDGASTSKRGVDRRRSCGSAQAKHEIIGVLLITASLLAVLSLLSFVPTDPPLFGSWPSQRTLGESSRNMIGVVGATVASVLFKLLGGGAYFLCGLLAMLGARCFVAGELAVTIRSVAGSVAALLFLCGLLQLEVTAIPTLSSGLVYRGQAGGEAGRVIADGLRDYFASTGAHILLVAGLLVAMLLSTPLSLLALGRRLSHGWRSLRVFIRSRLLVWWKRSTAPVWAFVLERWARTVAKGEKATPGPVKINRSEGPSSQTPSLEDGGGASSPGPMPALLQDTDASASALGAPVEPMVKASGSGAKRITLATEHLALDGYRVPDPRELLSDPPGLPHRLTDEQLKTQAEVLAQALRNFGIEGKVTEVHPGPVVTMYEFEPAPGVKVARILSLADDLALAMKAISLRIVAPLPGKSVVGVEVPNPSRETVSLKAVLMSEAFSCSRSKLRLGLGKDIFGHPVVADLKTMPHLLVAGATGSGKSMCLNTILLSLLFTARPDEVKLVLVDPKMLEFHQYDGLPHLLRPVITDGKSAARGLGWVVQEMERRYKLLAEAGVRNIDDYNRWVANVQGYPVHRTWGKEAVETDLGSGCLADDGRLSGGNKDDVQIGESRLLKEPEPALGPLPYIVVMIDELADLMAVAPKEVEEKIARLAQMARASGIHLVVATQRPSVDVLTGVIKANFPARIAFQVASKIDSRTILDANGAESLLGRGDMLYLASGTGKIVRLHGCFVSDADVQRVVDFVKQQAQPVYAEDCQPLKPEDDKEEHDEVYERAKEVVMSSGQASASLIQRRLRVGYPRAARMIEQMEREGLVSPPGRDGRRAVLVRRVPTGDEIL